MILLKPDFPPSDRLRTDVLAGINGDFRLCHLPKPVFFFFKEQRSQADICDLSLIVRRRNEVHGHQLPIASGK